MSKIFSLRSVIVASLVYVPFTVFAAINGNEVTTGFEKIGELVGVFTRSIVGALAVLALTLGVVAFFWGIVEYIWGLRSGDSKKEGVGRNFMLWGLIALFIMFSVWGIVRYAQRIFGIEGQTMIMIPDIQFQLGSGTGVRNNNTGINSPFYPSGAGGGNRSSNVNGSIVGGAPTGTLGTGSSVFGSDGSLIGRVNSSGNIVNSLGNVVGRLVNGKAVNNSGKPIGGSTVTTSNNTAAVKNCDVDSKTLDTCASECTGTFDREAGTCTTGPSGGSGTVPGPNGFCPDGKVYDESTATCMNSINPSYYDEYTGSGGSASEDNRSVDDNEDKVYENEPGTASTPCTDETQGSLDCQ